MKSFKEIIEEVSSNSIVEGKSESEIIRNILKKELGLTSRDVSVKSKSGGYSSSVTVSIKTQKALYMYDKIKNISKKFNNYMRDEATGEVLSGGNTFIFVKIDYDLSKDIKETIKNEIDKQTRGKFEVGDSIELFDVFRVTHLETNVFLITAKKASGSHSVPKESDIPSGILFFIEKIQDTTLYRKIK